MLLIIAKQETRGIAIIEACHRQTQYSEVRLDQLREAYGYGQGSRLSGQAESRDVGLDSTPPAAAQ
jgi:hypothetical protein